MVYEVLSTQLLVGHPFLVLLSFVRVATITDPQPLSFCVIWTYQEC